MRCEDAAVATHAEHDGSVIGTITTSASQAARSYRSSAHSCPLGKLEHRHDSDIDADSRPPAKAVVPSINAAPAGASDDTRTVAGVLRLRGHLNVLSDRETGADTARKRRVATLYKVSTFDTRDP